MKLWWLIFLLLWAILRANDIVSDNFDFWTWCNRKMHEYCWIYLKHWFSRLFSISFRRSLSFSEHNLCAVVWRFSSKVLIFEFCAKWFSRAFVVKTTPFGISTFNLSWIVIIWANEVPLPPEISSLQASNVSSDKTCFVDGLISSKFKLISLNSSTCFNLENKKSSNIWKSL